MDRLAGKRSGTAGSRARMALEIALPISTLLHNARNSYKPLRTNKIPDHRVGSPGVRLMNTP
jgi:hypothetical protein